jgi:outer membrane receptor for ferrienterochelin and colicins
MKSTTQHLEKRNRFESKLASVEIWPGKLMVVAAASLFFGLFGVLSAHSQESDAVKINQLKSLDLDALLDVKVEMVYGASRYAQKTTEAPSSISIISRDEIQRYGHRTLADVLQSVPGFHVSNDRNYSFLGARGINLGDFNSRILLLIDGHRVNNNLTDGAHIGTEFLLDVDLIERVEIIRGPGSVLYGNNAFFGVINVVTRKGAQVDGAEIAGAFASFDTYQGRATIGKSFTNGLDLLLSGTLYDSAGADQLFYKEFNDPTHNNGIAQDMDADSSRSFFGTVSYRDFTLQGGYVSREKVNPAAPQFTTFNDPSLRTIDKRSYADLKYAHAFTDVADVSARVYYDRNDFQIGYPVGDPVASAVYDEARAGQWWGAEIQANKKLWEKHIISAGAEYRDDFRQERTGSATSPASRTRQSYGVFVQGDFALLKPLHFNGGVRYDQYGDFDPSLNPRLALIYNPVENSTFKALYGTAFRSPNFLELSDPRFQDIVPETITSCELVYEQGIGRHLRSSVAGYYNRMDDLILFENGRFDNADAKSRGIEFALEGNGDGGVRGRASYSLQNAENRSSGGAFSDSPEHLIKLNLSVPLVKEKLFAGLEYQYTSSRHTVFTDNSANTVPGMDAKGFGVLNFTLFSHDIVKKVDFSASIYNVLGQSYADPSTRYHVQDQLPRDGRSFRLKLSYKF